MEPADSPRHMGGKLLPISSNQLFSSCFLSAAPMDLLGTLLANAVLQLKYLPPASAYLSDFALTYIGFSTIYARIFLTSKTPNVTFNLFYSILMMPFTGLRFIADAHAQGRAVYAWTVNDEQNMRWFMEHGVDGVITDDVKKLKDVRDARERGDRRVEVPLRSWIFVVWIWILTTIIGGGLRALVLTRTRRKKANAA